MRLHEYQAKRIFAEHGIAIPKGILTSNVEEVKKAAEELGGKVVLKSQILVGGRGKAGAIKKANSVEEAVEIAKDLFGKIIKGHVVRKIYVEEQLDIDREMYVGLTIDRINKGIAAIMSSVGGMDIEEIAREYPEKIATVTVDPRYGLSDYQIRYLLIDSGMPKEYWKTITGIVKALYNIFIKYEAELTEINPLIATKDGRILAADARLNIDDFALYRHKDLAQLRDFTEAVELEKIASEKGLNYVKLDGNIGIIVNGAGMAMSTMDLVYLEGGKPANFLDIGGGASAEEMKTAMEIILQDKDVKVLFINIFGGITRCDDIARGMISAFKDMEINVPIVLRLAGTNEEEGKRIIESFIKETNANIYLVDSMEDGAKKAVELAR